MNRSPDAWRPDDELDLGEPPEAWEQCPDCQGEGAIEKPRPFSDDPYFCIVVTCEACDGAGGRITAGEAS
jgi:DnaJ-class molecular chaperone